MRQGQLDSALIFTLNAIDVFEAIDEDQNIYAAYNNLALIYKNKGEFGKAVEIYEKMLDRLEGREITPSFAKFPVPKNTQIVVHGIRARKSVEQPREKSSCPEPHNHPNPMFTPRESNDK